MLQRALLRHTAFLGETGRLAGAISRNWLVGIRQTNPAILDMFRDRELAPYRDLLPWSGEFAGKYLTGAHAIYQVTQNAELLAYVQSFLDELLSLQAPDGYLGCYRQECRLTGAFSQQPEKSGCTWDAWSHYHIMYGLYVWYQETGDRRCWDAVLRIAHLFLRSFYGQKPSLVSIGNSEMNLAVYHMFALLYRETGEEQYLDFARHIEEDLRSPQAGDYLRLALAGQEFYQGPKPRWESLHVIMGFAELYRATNDEQYLQAACQIVNSILRTDVHNTGAFSTEEQAVGHPYQNGNIETCCVVAFNALAAQVYSLTGNPLLADHLERSHYNAVLGYYSPTGRWSTYNTPMDGVKCANYHSIVFQSRPGSPELNCCSVNAPRGVGLIASWALMEEEGTLYINQYEAMQAQTQAGLSISIGGDYPCGCRVTVQLDGGVRQKIRFRIPSWSRQTIVQLGQEEFRPAPGAYWELERQWSGETLLFAFDFTPRLEPGARDYQDCYSVLAGPVLYAWDRARNPALPFGPPALSSRQLLQSKPQRAEDGAIVLRLPGGAELVDFQHAGVSGSAYQTWLPVADEP